MYNKKMLKRETYLVLILLCVCLTLFFFRLGTRPLWDREEGKHATTSKEMVLSADWVTTTLNGEKFYDKTVLHNWFVALSFLVFGFTELAARLPAAVLSLGCVIVTYLLGRIIFGPTTGFVAGMILATSGLFISLARSVVHDISLVFFVSLALLFFYLGFTSEERRKTYFFLFYGALGFAVLAKGPIGLLLPGLIIGLFLLLKGKLSFLKKMHIGWGILIFLVIAAPWYVLISLRNSDYAGYFFIENNIMRFLSPHARHARPFWFYFPVLMGGFSPWSFFLPFALIHAFRGGWKNMNEGTLFLVLWFSVIFLFFTAASSKSPTYILPLFPAGSLLVGILWCKLLEAPTPWLRKGFLYSFLPYVVIMMLGALYLWINPPTILESRYGVNLNLMKWIAVPLVACLIVCFFMFLKKHYQFFFAGNIGLLMCEFLLFFMLIAPMINPYRSTKVLALRLDERVTPGNPLVFFDAIKDTALFYTDRRGVILRQRGELIEYLKSNPQAFVVIEKKYYEEIPVLKSISEVVDKEGNTLVISPNKPRVRS